MIKTVDLNCDLGEAFGNYPMPNDSLLMDYISSANIACGFHAGDAHVMEETIKLAIARKVAIGAHPGFPDLQGFGRREIKCSPREVYQITLYQIGALYAFVKAAGARLNHVKPHGALYNMAVREYALAEAIASAVKDFDEHLIVYGLAGSELINAARNAGLKTASEVFADRTYQDDGSLTPRSEPNSVIKDDHLAMGQVLQMVNERQVDTTSGKTISLLAETICLHGDGLHAVDFAREISASLQAENIIIKAPHS
ncbi:5-oxoprolinase subunit PxpA [Pedobacter frigidisoli]|uniref:LamB/YcsF family protein n=1 Tax=Pedobacter frigidisoli TaxID=2530455 RepID=UPI00292E9C5C|nr:5-oxoprolinase subunit PxpA [Pedobacter frigidisoli]